MCTRLNKIMKTIYKILLYKHQKLLNYYRINTLLLDSSLKSIWMDLTYFPRASIVFLPMQFNEVHELNLIMNLVVLIVNIENYIFKILSQKILIYDTFLKSRYLKKVKILFKITFIQSCTLKSV